MRNIVQRITRAYFKAFPKMCLHHVMAGKAKMILLFEKFTNSNISKDIEQFFDN